MGPQLTIYDVNVVIITGALGSYVGAESRISGGREVNFAHLPRALEFHPTSSGPGFAS